MARIEIKQYAHVSHRVGLTEDGVLIPWGNMVTPTAWMREKTADRSTAVQIGIAEDTSEPTKYQALLTTSGQQTAKAGLFIVEVDCELGGVKTTIPSGKDDYIEVLISPDVGGATS